MAGISVESITVCEIAPAITPVVTAVSLIAVSLTRAPISGSETVAPNSDDGEVDLTGSAGEDVRCDGSGERRVVGRGRRDVERGGAGEMVATRGVGGAVARGRHRVRAVVDREARRRGGREIGGFEIREDDHRARIDHLIDRGLVVEAHSRERPFDHPELIVDRRVVVEIETVHQRFVIVGGQVLVIDHVATRAGRRRRRVEQRIGPRGVDRDIDRTVDRSGVVAAARGERATRGSASPLATTARVHEPAIVSNHEACISSIVPSPTFLPRSTR